MKDTPRVTGDPRPDTGVEFYCLRCIPVTVFGPSRIQQEVRGRREVRLSNESSQTRSPSHQTDSKQFVWSLFLLRMILCVPYYMNFVETDFKS